jgi:hypothetical protein
MGTSFARRSTEEAKPHGHAKASGHLYGCRDGMPHANLAESYSISIPPVNGEKRFPRIAHAGLS